MNYCSTLSSLKNNAYKRSRKKRTAWKMPKYGVFSGPYFPVFRLNREKYGPEKLCIWTFLTQWKSIDTHLLSNPWSFQKNLLLMAKYPKKFIWKFSSKTESAFRVMQGHIIDISYVSTHYHVPMSSALNVCHPQFRQFTQRKILFGFKHLF